MSTNPRYDAWDIQLLELKRRFNDAIVEVRTPPDHPTDVPIVFVKPERILEVLAFAKTADGFEYGMLADLTATDEHPAAERFEVVYNLYSMAHHRRIRFKARLREGASIPTAIGLWPGANWAEREIFDMFGIPVADHPDLRRILNDPRFEGHPLRKDYDMHRIQIFCETEPIRTDLLENA